MIAETALEVGAFKVFEESGDVSGFWALADACDEGHEMESPRPHFAKLLRGVAAAANPAVHWFYQKAAFSMLPERETQNQGHLRCAACNAWYEAAAYNRVNAGVWRYRWEIDWNATDELHAEWQGERIDDDKSLYVCHLEYANPPPAEHVLDAATYRVVGYTHLESVGGVDLGDGVPPGDAGTVSDYAREVQAMLAHQALTGHPLGRLIGEEFPDWLEVEPQGPRTVEFCVLRVTTVAEMGPTCFALFPEMPSPDSRHQAITFPADEAYFAARCGLVDGANGRVYLQSINYREAMRASRPPNKSDPAAKWEFLLGRVRKLGIEPCVVARARAGFEARRNARRREMAAADAAPTPEGE